MESSFFQDRKNCKLYNEARGKEEVTIAGDIVIVVANQRILASYFFVSQDPHAL
jgi:hypothetical protein